MTKQAPRVVYHEDTEWVKKSEYNKLRTALSVAMEALEHIYDQDLKEGGAMISIAAEAIEKIKKATGDANE